MMGDDMENLPCPYLSYLFAGYAAIWIILFAYVMRLQRREKSLRQELELLQDRLEEKEQKLDF